MLAVDPSSTRTGGSILGDKTRMDRLAVDPAAFIRPSPTAGTLGGVAAATREAIVIVEAAGYDVVLVETVGVGQSETTVANLTDTFLVLMLARTGDSLQGIKKGVLELADVVTVNKADGKHRDEARVAARELSTALELLYPPGTTWIPPVLTCSATTGDGLDDVWAQVSRHRSTMEADGSFELDGPTSRCRGCGRRSTTRCCARSAGAPPCATSPPPRRPNSAPERSPPASPPAASSPPTEPASDPRLRRDFRGRRSSEILTQTRIAGPDRAY